MGPAVVTHSTIPPTLPGKLRGQLLGGFRQLDKRVWQACRGHKLMATSRPLHIDNSDSPLRSMHCLPGRITSLERGSHGPKSF